MLDIADNPLVDIDPRKASRALYFQGWRVSSIAKHMGIKRATVEAWKQRGEWDKCNPIDRVELTLEMRLNALIAKEKKEGVDFKEIDLLGRQMANIARVRKYGETGKEADLNPNIETRNAAPKKKPVRNEFSEEQQERLLDAFRDSLFDYQKIWYRNGHRRTRNILKSRQIGATWYFAREALADAIVTGRNQIFLSASKAQAHVFRQYITQFAREAADVDLTGDPIVLQNEAILYFLGTNARTAQSYHGNFYFDEYFWVPKFNALNKVASGMAMHKQWRKTYFSTPSSIGHEAYSFWSGAHINRKRAKADHVHFEISHRALSAGRLCEDRQWRQIVTVEDAAAGGCTLFDLDELRLEYSPEEYANLLMCQFIDDTASIFQLADLQRCMVDSWEEWADDYRPLAARPFGYAPVWVGYDPALTGDSAGLAVVAPPVVPGGKFRVLEKIQWRGMDFEAQARNIEQVTQRYNVTYMAIDTTGIGQGVYQLVKQFYPRVVALNYSPEVKGRLVLKGLSVVGNARLQFDAGWTDVAQSFMAIRKTMTPSGRQVTYEAGRSEETGHADLAWAVLHAISNEPLEGMTARNTGFMEIYA
ncbi:terminase ATPase subunit family protein [Paraburkholderia aspalathi]|uniref:terminase ATPase subunit family protein n=1 Tax=Paraburkholderia aspalathi TaxID=1324617 RepID=UPI001909B083|nr:terminase ATPase subunit family protein [Paraburkholderia aspalathi]MBK3842971.1 terminase ATPase subunit family protein [Paraburkholderia aspalathi]